MAKAKILLVEDDDDSRHAVCTVLEALGYEVKACPEGQSAILAVRASITTGTLFNLGLFDIMLPGMNGYEVLQEVKKNAQYKNLPCVMLTAKDADTEMLEGYKYGADYYIPKPFTPKQLQYGVELFLGEM